MDSSPRKWAMMNDNGACCGVLSLVFVFFPTGLGDGGNRNFMLVNDNEVVVVVSKILEDRSRISK